MMSLPGEYKYREDFRVTDQVQKNFEENGYILLRGVLDKEEVNLILKPIEGSDALTRNTIENVHECSDPNKKRKTETVVWSHPGHDVTGMVSRSEKVAGICEQLLGGEVYHYHTKLMVKNAHKGAKHVWHQDYGYWYLNGNLFPDMMTVWIPLDPVRRTNSCLQILQGSNRCGRIDHVVAGTQYGADPERLALIKEKCPHHYVEMEPGDALYFHCNLLHHSADNESNMRRWAFISSYNKATNNPTKEHHHPRYTPLHKVPNSSIKSCTNFTDMTGKIFVDPADDHSNRGSYLNQQRS